MGELYRPRALTDAELAEVRGGRTVPGVVELSEYEEFLGFSRNEVIRAMAKAEAHGGWGIKTLLQRKALLEAARREMAMDEDRYGQMQQASTAELNRLQGGLVGQESGLIERLETHMLQQMQRLHDAESNLRAIADRLFGSEAPAEDHRGARVSAASDRSHEQVIKEGAPKTVVMRSICDEHGQLIARIEHQVRRLRGI